MSSDSKEASAQMQPPSSARSAGHAQIAPTPPDRNQIVLANSQVVIVVRSVFVVWGRLQVAMVDGLEHRLARSRRSVKLQRCDRRA